ncbi:two component transcriptional regulator, winged helix family [Caldicellulosiruptor acetigenus I77R1B]|uniref:Two component transcriptional regulator, winged helix family n=1 Tax=Caldicellulosiruptor acetigenus (strain ATCC 700853 / DSM 12137 / I77R1B) TaxID=632335 RepID=E4S611_CALA7|nr:response regulator transcription factor [Caldicellulosiruptor acetigenus]ADQ39684.1 two component transcriptional regulator, winged helix family [Caldicellulosiruptor acetigenus I77R1B]WAM36492.1 response regulator transcription factor [Caldicellulosiruptor acetigenus]
MANILVVEDQQDLNQIITRFLKNEGFNVINSYTAKDALEKLNDADLIILDIMLPDMEGYEVLKEASKKGIPTIILTSKSEEFDKLKGFELGAEDYITKPFSMLELIARVKVVLRRNRNFEESIKLLGGKVEIFPKRFKVIVDGEDVNLTHKEFELLLFLAKNKDLVKSRDEILEKVWGFDFIGETRTVDVHIKQLREKLKDYKFLIKTVWGVGYKLSEERE